MNPLLITLSANILLAFTAYAQQITPPSARVEANRVAEVPLVATKNYEHPFTEVELDAVVTKPDGSQVRVPAFWNGGAEWCFRYSSNQTGTHAWRTETKNHADSGLHGRTGRIEITAATAEHPLYTHGAVRVAADHRHFERADGTPFFWLGDTWWKGLCKRIPWAGFQELTADRKAKGFTVVQIVCGTYPDEPGLLRASWANEGGLPYLRQDFSEVNPDYFKHADRRFQHLVEAGIVPAIVGGWGRAVNLSPIGLPGYKRHFRQLIARYGAYPVIWILGGETHKGQGPWHELAQYVKATDPYHRLLCNHSSHLREALEDSAEFDFDMDATGHNAWGTVNSVLGKTRSSRNQKPLKPFVSGESCYELHMQQNPAYLQRYQFWALMLAGAAGHTYGAAGIWHMATAQEHGNWGAWRGQPYDLTTWNEGMNFPGSAQLGHGKALLSSLPWQQFTEHPEWVENDAFAAGIPEKMRVIYQPIRGVYKWDGITIKDIEPGSWSAFYFDPVTGRRHDLGVHDLSGTWKSPNVPSPQDWVLVMQTQKTGKMLALPGIKAGETCSGKLEPSGAIFTKKAGPKWLEIRPDGSYTGTPLETNVGKNTFLVMARKPGEDEVLMQMGIHVLGAKGETFVENFAGYKGIQNAKQADTGLNVAHGGTVSGWTQSGAGAVHAVDRSFKGGEVTPSDWAVMIFEDNVLNSPAIDANAPGKTYELSFESGPAVYANASQATQNGAALLVEVLRADKSVLASATIVPGAWAGKLEFASGHLQYKGDGSGNVHLRIGPAQTKTGRFQGAIDNIALRLID